MRIGELVAFDWSVHKASICHITCFGFVFISVHRTVKCCYSISCQMTGWLGSKSSCCQTCKELSRDVAGHTANSVGHPAGSFTSGSHSVRRGC